MDKLWRSSRSTARHPDEIFFTLRGPQPETGGRAVEGMGEDGDARRGDAGDAVDILLARRVESGCDADAWSSEVLDRVEKGQIHLFCSKPEEMPAAVLTAGWEAWGPPPPPSPAGDGVGIEANASTEMSPGWARLERCLGLGCHRCVDAYRRQIDAWDADAREEEDDDTSVLAALMRERDERRLVRQARQVVASTSGEDTGDRRRRLFIATAYEAFVSGHYGSNECCDAVGDMLPMVGPLNAARPLRDALSAAVASGDVPGLFQLLARSDDNIRAAAKRCFAALGESRPVRGRLPEETARVIDDWIDTLWSAFEEHATSQSQDPGGSSAHANKRLVAWSALADALQQMGPIPRGEVLARHPNVLSAALDELTDEITDNATIGLFASRVMSELLPARVDSDVNGSPWLEAGVPPGTAVDMLEAAARQALNADTRDAIILAIITTLESLNGSSEREDVAASTSAMTFLTQTVPKNPHLFDECTLWIARRGALDVIRRSFALGRPPRETNNDWATTVTVCLAADPSFKTNYSVMSTARATKASEAKRSAKMSAETVAAMGFRADAAALSALAWHAAGNVDGGVGLVSDGVNGIMEEDAMAHSIWEDGLDKTDDRSPREIAAECSAGAIASRLDATSSMRWTCDPDGWKLTRNSIVVNGLLAAAADLALSPKPKDKTPADGGVANVSAVDLTNSASVGARLSSELLQSCTALAASPDPLAAASLPFDAIRAAVAMLMGQRADLRSAGRVLLSCQALGVSRKSEVVGPEVWMKVCAVPEATLAALEGAADALAAAMELGDASMRVSASSWCLFQCKSLIPCAAEASTRGAMDDLWRQCVVARAALTRDVWDHCVGVISDSRHLAGESFSQGDLVRVFQCMPDLFNLWYKGASEAKEKPLDPNADEVYENDVFETLAHGARDEFAALSWLQDCVRWGTTALTPAVANHWMKALEGTLEAATGPLKITKIGSLPFTAKEAAKEVFVELHGKQAERLAKWFPDGAPGNLGVGMLDALPARREQNAGERSVGQAREQPDQTRRPSIRERLQAMSTPLGRTLGKGDDRIPAPGSRDELDAWNTERGGFADYPPDEENDYGSGGEKDRDHDVIDLLSPGSVRGSGGIGTALGGGSNWQPTSSLGTLWGQPQPPPSLPSDGKSPYERAMEKAQRNKSSRRTTTPMADGDILASIRAGGPTHKRAPAKGGVNLPRGMSPQTAKDARMAAAARQNLADLHRERDALAQKREGERAAAKAARLARLAERRGDDNVIDLVNNEGADRGASRREQALAALENAERLRKTATIAPVVKASSRTVVARRPIFGSKKFEPPWTPPRLDDLVGAALRWSMGHIRSTRTDQERTGSFARRKTFTSAREYIEHFAPLMLAELRAQLASALDESGGNPPGVVLAATVDQLVGNEGSYHSLRINLGRTAVGDAFLENDLVLIEKQRPASGSTTNFPTPHCFAWVEGVESGARSGKSQASDGGSGVCLRVKVCLVETPDATVQWLTGNGGGSLNRDKEVQRRMHMLRALSRQGGSLKLSRLSSLTTVLREMQALVHVQKVPIFKALFHPSRNASSSSRNPDTPPDGIGMSFDQWSSIATSLNGPQLEAVHTAASASACKFSRKTLVESNTAASKQIVLIQGPPGTGKTHTIASLVQAALIGNEAVLNGTRSSRMRRVLVCAQSNSAVDELVVRLADRIDAAKYGPKVSKSSDRRLSEVADGDDATDTRALVRLGREDAVRTDALPYLVTRAVDSSIRPNDTAASEREKEVSIVQSRLERLSKDIKHETSLAEGKEENPGQLIHLQMLQAQRRKLLGELAIMRQKQRKQRDGAKKAAGSAWTRVVGGAEIVCATLSGAGLLAADRTGARAGGRGRGGVKQGATSEDAEAAMVGCAVPLFDLIIVDEAAQATEAATLVPLRWLRPGGAAAFVGDPQQLAATVLSCGSAKRSIEQSLFERLQDAGARTHLLSVQYRMHPEIRQFPSDAFYDGKLVDGNVVPHGSLANLGAYVAFDVAEGYEQRGRFSGQSLSNAAEASLAAVLYTKLLSRADVTQRVTVGVVAPYKDQIAQLKRVFEPLIKGRPEAHVTPVEFATVDGVQGREFDVVIFSCVRAIQGMDAASVDLTDEFEYMNDAEAAAHSRRMIGFLSDRRRLNVALTRPKRALFVLGHAATLRRADEIWSMFWGDAERRGVAIRALRPYGLHNFDRWERVNHVPSDEIKVEEKLQVMAPDVIKPADVVKDSRDAVVDLTLDDDAVPMNSAREPPRHPAMSARPTSKPVKRRADEGNTPSWLHEPLKPKKPKVESTGAGRVRPVQALQTVPKSRSTGKTTTYRTGDTFAKPSATALGAGPSAQKMDAMRRRAEKERAEAFAGHEPRVSLPPKANKKPPPGGVLNSILKGMRKNT